MIEMRRAQLSFGDGLIAEEVSDLREDWMKHADAVGTVVNFVCERA
jgi:IS5 family transposase